MMEGECLKALLRTAYDRRATMRDLTPTDPWKVVERTQFLGRLRACGAATLLDVGAGPGHEGLFFAESGLTVVAVDASREMVALCRAKGLVAHQMDLVHLDLPAASFDSAWSMNCLLHVPRGELDQALESIRRVLRPGGLFYLGLYGGQDSAGVWEGDDYEPKRYFSFHTDEALQATVARHFEILRFAAVDYGSPDLHYQSLLLTKSAPSGPSGAAVAGRRGCRQSR